MSKLVDGEKLLKWIENNPEADGFWNGAKSLAAFDNLTDAINLGILAPSNEAKVNSYPTPDAYEAACKALWNHRDKSSRLLEVVEYLRNYPFVERNEDIRVILRTVDQALSNHKEEKMVLPRAEVRWFAEQMELTLRANEHKGGWQNCNHDYLMSRLHEEVEEIHELEGVEDIDPQAIVRECADVANFAMMIADNERGRLSQPR